MSRRARGSVFKRRRKDRSIEDVWTISYHVGGRRVAERAYTDKAASEALLAKRLRDAARDQVGLSDPYRRHRGRPLAEHLEDFLAGVTGRARTPKHARLLRARLQRAFAGMSARAIADLDLTAVDRWLAGLLAEGLSVKTRDHYAWALRQFGVWLLDTERAPRNPFHRLHAVAKAADVKRERMALTAQQILALADAAEVRPVACYRVANPMAQPETMERLRAQGHRRGLLYLFSALTGLRRAECAGVRWMDLEIRGAEGSWVTPRAKTTKSRRREPLPLDATLADRLEALRRSLAVSTGRLPAAADPVFAVPKNLTEQLRKDAEYAKIPTVDQDGRILDFHALRATCGTLLARAGVPMQMARRLMRHSSPSMTAKHYEKLTREDLRIGSDLLATSFWGGVPAAQTVAISPGTGTNKDEQGRNEPGDGRRATP